MKQCPTCRTTYTDESLRFCLADGAPLIDLGGEQPTVVRQSVGGPADEKTVAMGGGEMRVDIPQGAQSQPQYQPAAPTASPGGSSGGLLKVLLVILGLGIFIVLLAIVGLILFYKPRPEQAANNGPDRRTPGASPAATKEDNDELRDLIANLEKQLADQKNGKRPSIDPLPAPTISSTTIITTARANSPGDGFLALRTLPNSELGERILKIPHGAPVSIGVCGPVVRPVSKSGRWCQASYGGRSGWVFDAYLIY